MSDESEGLFKSRFYFDLKEAADDVVCSYGIADKTKESAVLLGKAVCNTGVFAGKLGLEFLKNLPRLAEEKRAELESMRREKSKE